MTRSIIICRMVVVSAVVLACAVPLVLTPSFIFPFSTGKSLYIELLAAAALPFWIVLLILDPGSRPQPHRLTLLVAAQFLVLLFAGVFGVDPIQSFWGRDERLLGLVTLLALLLIFGMALSVFRSDRSWRNLLIVVVGIAAVNILWGVSERIFPSFWVEYRGGSHRVTGLIGNPIFYAGYLLGIAFLSVSIIPFVRRRWATVILVALGAGAVLGVMFSGTRGAQLGLLAGIGATFLWAALSSSNRRVRWMILGCAAAFSLVVVVLTLTVSYEQQHPLLSPFARLRSSFNISDPTARQRFLLWGVALEGIRERPVLGWGPENIDYLLDRHFDPRLLTFTVSETFADRAHNAFIDSAAEAGILNFAALIAIQVAFLSALLRRQREGRPVLFCAALAGFLIATDIALFFSFHTLPTLLTFLFASGWVVSGESMNTGRERRRVRYAVVAASAAMVCSAAFILIGIVRPAAAFSELHQANITDPSRDPDGWLRHLRAAVRLRSPYRIQAQYRAGNAIFSAVGERRVPDDRVVEALGLGIESLRAAAERAPGDYGYRFSLGNLLLLSSVMGDPSQFAPAEREFLRAVELSPRRQSTYIQLGNLKVVSGDPGGSLEYYRHAVLIDPGIGEPHWHLGRGLYKAGEREAAAEEFIRAIELGFRPRIKEELREAASALLGVGNLASTIRVYEIGVEKNPEDADLFAELAAAYGAAGRIEEARKAVVRAVELDPSLAEEAEIFLNQLPSTP